MKYDQMCTVRICFCIFDHFRFEAARNKCSQPLFSGSSSPEEDFDPQVERRLGHRLRELNFMAPCLVQDFRTAGMGLDKAKSLLQVTQGFTFLDLLLDFNFGQKRFPESSLPIAKNAIQCGPALAKLVSELLASRALFTGYAADTCSSCPHWIFQE